MDDQNTPGRKANEAEAPGAFTALGGRKAVERTGKASQSKAGPDGGSAAAVGDTFKKDSKSDRA
ncbi:hypothetical protein [Caulobacter hibisci]|uniref:Stress-induced protein n=1 Tax=Caulobacter hibisci TaxID=2035993 RepID=A0ABS0SXK4_9CAUL|nr:hypothetical protein [Caulobacter hibisci]MBI1684149.1 hypothetical protein [Caulobacter hibisci]